ncbi:LuxR C-terminal-related transcriptional regulator [Streptomyces sp. NPDC051662]|uniref:helix-turn-helix transcriptional regulator n=1 Tax=Streptomyces sp. NPDC051662 TaxID=3154750 RepID=UPI003433C246
MSATSRAVAARHQLSDEPRAPIDEASGSRPVTVFTTARVDRACHDALKSHYERHPETTVVLVADRVTPHDISAIAPYGLSAVVCSTELRGDPDLLEGVKALAAAGAYRLPHSLGIHIRNATTASGPTRPRHALGQPGVLLRPQEVDVMVLTAQGLKRRRIAQKLGREEEHVKYMLKRALNRLGVATRAEAVAYAAREGFLWAPAGDGEAQ